MTKKIEIYERIKKYNLTENCSMTENKSAYILKKNINNIDVKITIPINVYEIFFDAKNLLNGKQIKEWRDYYGDDQNKDYLDDLENILLILSNKSIRYTENLKTVEYKDVDWKHFFGNYE